MVPVHIDNAQFLNPTHPVSPNWQWMCCVHVPLPIIARLSVTKDLHLEVPHHGVHHLPTRQGEQDS